MEVYSIAVLNFIIIFISLFYVMNVSPTFKRLLSCFFLNLLIAFIAAEFQEIRWLPILLCLCLGGGLFYQFTKNRLVFLHIINIHLLIIVIEVFILLIAVWAPIPFVLHGFVILMLLFGSLYVYKRLTSSLLYQIDKTAKQKWSRYIFLLSSTTLIIFNLQMPAPTPNGDLQVTVVNAAVLMIYSLLLLLSYKLLVSVWKREIELKQTEAERYYFYKYMTELEKTNKRMRSIQHDHANILLSLNGYIYNQDMKGLTAYFRDSVLKTGQHDYMGLPHLGNLNITEIKGLLGGKMVEAKEQSIAVQIEIPEKIDCIHMDILDIVRILGILLDNAIEASMEHHHPQIQIAIFHTEKNSVLMVIKNSHERPYPEMSKLFEEGFSTKGTSRGNGLFNVKQLLTKYPAASLHSYVEDGWFIQELLIERSID